MAMYSKMLYMSSDPKVRMTFRLDPALAEALRHLSNQTLFVETALVEALGQACPTCRGSGRVLAPPVVVSDFKRRSLPRLDRGSALRLRQVVRLARWLLADRVEIDFSD